MHTSTIHHPPQGFKLTLAFIVWRFAVSSTLVYENTPLPGTLELRRYASQCHIENAVCSPDFRQNARHNIHRRGMRQVAHELHPQLGKGYFNRTASTIGAARDAYLTTQSTSSRCMRSYSIVDAFVTCAFMSSPALQSCSGQVRGRGISNAVA